ncbi:chorismate mutase [Paenibacillus sp. Y412MC10]|uniref:chorismate mutase n=1 Tax=Geobacillus sp. (strain Y412MC10) TaxID=481743 RepID=UPI0011AB8648|nr:chorismate mutase [Paenibacillus sp. Y412MC10]
MKRMPFTRPTEHYDERLLPIDRQICQLLQQRKEISEGNPGYPPFAYIDQWAAETGLYEDFLKMIFGAIRSDEFFKPIVEPAGFIKHVPVLVSQEHEGYYFTLTSVRQYANASVVTLHVDGDVTIPECSTDISNFALDMGEYYDCRMDRGVSCSGNATYNYVVSPPLPDKLSGLEFVFREEIGSPFGGEPTGKEIRFRVEE